jgi:hypothetical protein
MDTPHDVPVRSARDRIIDLLGVGDSYPLTDLNVIADQLKVAFGGTAKIPIEDAQVNVTYQLCDPKGKPLGDAFKADGQGATLVIETPKVQEDITYRILATKKNPPDSKLAPQSSRFLNEGAPVKVGIDTGLVIELRDVPLLDRMRPTSQPSDPRIVPYGQSVDVWVDQSQEGVLYSLILDGRDLPDALRGDLHDIALPTGPMREDTVIQVRATKKFLASENRSTETALLDAKLYLKVMADPGLAVSVDPSPIVDYSQDATIKIAKTQPSAKYRAYARTLPDADFVHGDAAGADIVTVAVPDKPAAQVRKPRQSGVWRMPEGYAPQGDAPAPGTGSDLKLTVKSLAEDAIVIVQALKEHRVDADKRDSAIITSAVRLDPVAVVLVRPDPAKALRLRVPVIGAQTGDSMQVSDGQPGVFYYFRRAPSGAEFPLAAYFHKRDQQDAPQNKGVGQLGIEIDFAIATDAEAAPAGANLAMVYPRPPLLGIAAFATGGSLSSRAVKAQTAVEVQMAQNAQIAAVPAIRAEPPMIDYGGSAKIVIPASNAADQYQLTLKGAPVKGAAAGTGSDLAVLTDALSADAIFEMVVTRPADKGMPVERVVQVSVLVRPDTALPVSARLDTVVRGTGTDIVVRGSQSGVMYQLMSGPSAIGSPMPGGGAELSLPTGPISADTTFTVAAARTDNAQIAAVLKTPASVKLAPPPPPPPPPVDLTPLRPTLAPVDLTPPKPTPS